MTRLARLALCAAILALPAFARLPGMAGAAMAEGFSQADVLEGAFRAGWKTKDGAHVAALHLRLAPKWKTYWRAPGDAGIPPQFDWSGSENLASVRFHWPAPEVFHANGMRSVGYDGELVLPFEVVPRDPSRPVRLKARIDLGICRDICLPAGLVLDRMLPPAGQEDRAISAALRARPATAREAGLSRIVCTVEPIRDGLRVTARMDLPTQGSEEMVVFEPGLPGIWVSEAMTTRKGAELTAVAEMVPPSGQPFALNRSAMVVTVIGTDGRAVEINGCPAP